MLTDLSPEQAQICWYRMRSWIECLFKDIKRGGLGWHHTKMTDPARAERLWLAIAVATMWLVSVGGQAEANASANGLPLMDDIACVDLQDPNLSVNRSHTSNQISAPTRLLSCFRRGCLTLLASLVQGLPLPLGSFMPDFFPGTG